jgi:hypothetical protein
MAVEPKVSRLKSLLMNTGLQQKDNKLFQILDRLISALQQNQAATNEAISSGGGGAAVSGDLLTWSDETGSLPNSRELLAGTNITFDDTVANERTVKGSSWDVLTDGDLTQPELIFAGGEVIMLTIP